MRVAAVGLGWVAREVWIPRLLNHARFELVGVVDSSPETLRSSAEWLGGRSAYADYRDVPLDEIEAAFVFTPNSTHVQIAEWFLRRGVSVFLEKPGCTNRSELLRLRAAVAHGKGRLAVSAAARHRSDVAAMAEIVSSDALGEPRLAELSWVRGRGIPGSMWFSRRADAGGGALLDLGWHMIDVAHYLWGSSRVRAAAAVMSSDFLKQGDASAEWHSAEARLAAAEPDVEDQLTALLATERYGMSLQFAWASHESVDRTVIALHGTLGTLVLMTTFGFSPRRVERPSLWLRSNGCEREIDFCRDEVGDEYTKCLDNAADELRSAERTEQTMHDIEAILGVVSSCYRAGGVG
jgi:oxidoreductase